MDRALIVADPEEPSPGVIERAAQWLAHLESGDASERDRARYEDWRAAHPSHGLAIERMAGFAAGGQDNTLENRALDQLFRRSRSRRAATLLGVALVIGVAGLLSRSTAVQLYLADQRTGVGELRTVPLSDGSSIVMGTDSAVDLPRLADRQEVRLLRGALMARVAHQHHAPFTVVTSDGTARAMGTGFVVSKETTGTQVTVITSHVLVCPQGVSGAGCALLAPGQRARIVPHGLMRLPDVDPADASGWAEGWLTVSDRPLVEVLDTINGWRVHPVRFDPAELADLRVSGVFPLRDTDRALTNLGHSQPIGIDRSDPLNPSIRRLVKQAAE